MAQQSQTTLTARRKSKQALRVNQPVSQARWLTLLTPGPILRPRGDHQDCDRGVRAAAERLLPAAQVRPRAAVRGPIPVPQPHRHGVQPAVPLASPHARLLPGGPPGLQLRAVSVQHLHAGGLRGRGPGGCLFSPACRPGEPQGSAREGSWAPGSKPQFSVKGRECHPSRVVVGIIPSFILLFFHLFNDIRLYSRRWGYSGEQGQCRSWVLVFFWHMPPLEAQTVKKKKKICLQCRRPEFDPWVGNFWQREWQSTPVFLPGESHGQRSLAGYSP